MPIYFSPLFLEISLAKVIRRRESVTTRKTGLILPRKLFLLVSSPRQTGLENSVMKTVDELTGQVGQVRDS